MTKENQTQRVSGAMTDAEFLSKRLARVANLVGVPMPVFSHEGIAEVAGTILGQIASKLESPRAQDAQAVRNAALEEVYSAFGIGEQARTPSVLMSSLRNVIRFAEMLHAIEREFFMVPGEPDEDYPDAEPQDECLVNSWGSTVPEYIEQFRSALRALQSAPAQPVERPDAVELPPLPEPLHDYMSRPCFTENQMREYALAALSHVRGKAQEPEGWRDFLESCATFAGYQVNGNSLSQKAKELLAAAPQVAQEEGARDEFAQGVIAALGVLRAHGYQHGSTFHDEIVNSVGESIIYAAAEDEDYEWAGLDPSKKPKRKASAPQSDAQQSIEKDAHHYLFCAFCGSPNKPKAE